MKQFILKLILFSLPFILLIVLYFIQDPFKVLYRYKQFYDKSVQSAVFLNRDYVSTANFDNNYSQQKYNSFIFGNSRTWFYHVSEWKKYIGNESCYHFDAADEALFAIHKKIKYLDRKNVDLKNVLLVLDFETLIKDKEKSGHLGMISPQLIDNHNFFKFHLASVKAFLNIRFLYAYFDFTITGKFKQYMKNHNLIESRPFEYDYITNEIRWDYFESLILENEYYTKERIKNFSERKKIDSIVPIIGQNQKVLLHDIYVIFRKKNTNYKVIVSPLYNNYNHLAEEDLLYLKSLFGDTTIYDFSGKNEITNDFRNYYEPSHYRPHIANKILKTIYCKDSTLNIP